MLNNELLCLYLVAFDHGFSHRTKLLCCFVYFLLCLFMVSHRTKLLCFFVYLLFFLFMVCHRTNPYASLFISCCFCSWFLTEPTPMLLCLSLVVFVHGFSQNQLLCFFVYLLLFLFMVSHSTNSYASLFISCSFCSWFFTEPTPMLICLSLVVFVHGFSQNQLLCFFFLSLVVFVHGSSQNPTPMLICLSLIVFVHGLSQNQPLCFFVYLLLFLFMVSHRTNPYASLFISCCFCSWFLTGPTPMLLCLSLVLLVHGFSLLGTDHTNCAWQWIDTFHKKNCFSFLQQEKMM
jgi:hypothetical protein